MSRYVVSVGKFYESTPNCDLCKAIDRVSVELLDSSVNQGSLQSRVEELDKLLVNGYDLVRVVEANAAVNQDFVDDVKEVKSFNPDAIARYVHLLTEFSTKPEYNATKALEPSLVFSRWCSQCGARKHDVFEPSVLLDPAAFYLRLSRGGNRGEEVTLTWNPEAVTYPLAWRVIVTRHADNEDQTLARRWTVDDPMVSTLADSLEERGRDYTYVLTVEDELGEPLITRTASVFLVDTAEGHVPLPITGLAFIRHKRLLKGDDGSLHPEIYVRVTYQVDPDDPNFGAVVIKLNDDHVPSLEYWVHDLYVDDEHRFFFPKDGSKSFFVKAFVRSRLFQRDGTDDAERTPDLYYWNESVPPIYLTYEEFPEDLFNLAFRDGRRSLKISYSLKWRNTVRFVRVMFKQSDQWITDDDDGTYKVVDVPAVHALYDYEVTITGLASNTTWVFGVFPVYEDTDPDVRLEYQHMVKVRPWYPANRVYGLTDDMRDLYYIGLWHMDDDFTSYHPQTGERLLGLAARNHRVLWADNLPWKGVAPFLLRDLEVGESCTLTYDYKVIASSKDDHLNCFVNDALRLASNYTYGWLRATHRVGGDGLFVHWEQQKMGKGYERAATFIDNIRVRSQTVRDLAVDNLTRFDEIRLRNMWYFNRKIRFNRWYLYVPDKYYAVDVKVNDYVTPEGELVPWPGVSFK